MRKLERFENYLKEKVNNRISVSLYSKSIVRGASIKGGVDIIDYDVNYSHSLIKSDDLTADSELTTQAADYTTILLEVEKDSATGITPALLASVSSELDALELSSEEMRKMDKELSADVEMNFEFDSVESVDSRPIYHYGDYFKYHHELWPHLSFKGMSSFIHYEELDSVLEQYLDICERLTKEVVYLRVLKHVCVKDKIGGYLVYYNGITCYLPMKVIRHLSCQFLYDEDKSSPTHMHLLQVHDLSGFVSPLIRVEAGEVTLSIGHVSGNFISSEESRRLSPSLLTFVFSPL